MNEKRFYMLLSRKLAGEATKQELNELSQLIQQNEDFRLFVKNIDGYNDPSIPVDQMAALDTFDTISWQLDASPFETISVIKDLGNEKGRKKPFMQWVYSGLALISLLLVIGLVIVPFSFKGKQPIGLNSEIVTGRGQKSALTLSDGTKVWLNTDSKLIYSNDFSGKTREVVLVGEAFFDVSHDKKKPFIIHTRDMHIKVLGTAFNVRAYPNEKSSEASLISGIIQVSFTKRPNEQLMLKPNEKITFSNTDIAPGKRQEDLPLITLENITVEPSTGTILETAWTKGKFAFKSRPFMEIVEELERIYDVEIEIERGSIQSRRFTASFDNETLDEILMLLKMSYHFDFTYDKKSKQVRIY
jgi:transmembrane sensor